MTDIGLLARRVEALEEAQLDARVSSLEVAARHNAKQIEWMTSTLGRVAATQDQHTKELTALRADVTAIKADLSGLRCDLPSIVADAMREVLKPGGD
jgi:pyridoxine 5'-phosphate synthase PdxJ